jgi:uncharacterized protein (TIGR01777 family)
MDAAMNILVSGSSGLLGGKLLPRLREAGHQVFRLVRRKPAAPDERRWNPEERVDPIVLDRIDAVIHLAGDNIGEGRWTEEKKRQIRDSRVNGTRRLAQAIAEAPSPPKSLICASATGYYGNRGDALLDETSPAGMGFLPEVCREWEQAADAARAKGVRVANARLGVVLSTEGGALAKLLLPFKMGVGGVVGDGKQYWSCIGVEDAAAVFQFLVENDKLSGPVNAVMPEAVTNYEFTKTLGRILGRPTLFPLPKMMARLALGQMADELILASTRVAPKALQAAGFVYSAPTIEAALRATLEAHR